MEAGTVMPLMRYSLWQSYRYNGNAVLTVTGILIYAFTAWSRVLLEKLTGSQPVKKFPAFYGTRRFISAFTSARHPSLS